MATVSHDSRMRHLLELRVLPEIKLLLIAIAEFRDPERAEQTVGLPVDPAVYRWLSSVGLLDEDGRVDWEVVQRRSTADAREYATNVA